MTRACALLVALLTLAPMASADGWQVIAPESSLTFSATQAGTPFTGEFRRFQATITFDPDHAESAHVRAEVDLFSATTGSEDRDSALQSPIWFDTASMPKAIYEATGFKPLGGNRFEAEGTLTLKGITAPLTLQFTLEIDGETAHAAGGTKIVRTDFKVGSGDFESGKWISKAVDVHFTLAAQRMTAGEAP